MRKTALLLVIFSLITKILGFIRDIVLSYFYGASNISDAYIISTTIPIFIFSFIGTGIFTAYIPMYSTIVAENGVDDSNDFTNNLLNISLVICTIIIIFGLIFTKPLTVFFASGFDNETLEIATKFTKIALISVYFTCVMYIFNGFLQVKGDYITPVIVGIPVNICIIFSIYLSSRSNIKVLAFGTLIATALQVLLIIPALINKDFRYKGIINFKDVHIIKMFYIAVPAVIGVSVNQINVLVDRTLASQIAIGGISALTYANKLNLFIQGIFVMSISSVIFPIISKLSAENKLKDLKKTLSESINVVNLLVIPSSFGVLIYSQSIVNLLFGRGEFDYRSTSMTAEALFYYSIGMIGFGLREIFSKVFYSLQDTRTPMINGVISMVLNVILNIYLSRYLGIGGLALATSISAIIGTLLLFRSLVRRVGDFGISKICINFLKILIASLIMATLSKLTYNQISFRFSQYAALFISITVGVVTYIVTIILFKIDDVELMIKMIKSRGKKYHE